MWASGWIHRRCLPPWLLLLMKGNGWWCDVYIDRFLLIKWSKERTILKQGEKKHDEKEALIVREPWFSRKDKVRLEDDRGWCLLLYTHAPSSSLCPHSISLTPTPSAYTTTSMLQHYPFKRQAKRCAPSVEVSPINDHRPQSMEENPFVSILPAS